MSLSYSCRDYPGMETCPGHFEAETEAELWKHMELHASAAHDEDTSAYSEEELAQVQALIKTVD